MCELIRFVEVTFADIEQVKGRTFWYLCGFDVEVGDGVVVQFGLHGLIKQGTVSNIIFADVNHPPFPMEAIKMVREVIKDV